MSVLILGSEGSMGTRYQAILRHMNAPFVCADRHTGSETILEHAKRASGIIIATPTDIHTHGLNILTTVFKGPILCEKPLAKTAEDLLFIRDEIVRTRKTNLTMTMQYEILLEAGQRGDSYYDYFRHGSDGLAWDCLQIIGLAKDKIDLKEKSPIWQCAINGQQINVSEMDRAYVAFVRRWLTRPGDDISRLFDIHMKVMEYRDGKKY